MKIGLVGNMNNNNFAMMRYFRDLGADAHLLLYSNDGTGSLKHFTPEADTWETERWAPYIHQTDVPNALIGGFDFPVSALLNLVARLRGVPRAQRMLGKPVSRCYLRRTYGDYDKLVASGTTPAVLLRVNRGLDVFYPYATGVEYLGVCEFTALERGGLARRLLARSFRKRQTRGLVRAKHVICTDKEVTGAVLDSIGVQKLQQTIPMVYNRESAPADPPTSVLADAARQIETSDFTILHHARLMWKAPPNYSEDEHQVSTKNSDWLFRAFAGLLAKRPSCQPILFVVEYGPDVAATKALVAELGIGHRVSWLPKMARKELMWLLGRVSIGVGEFMNPRCMIWGGTGWEALAAGKPLLQGFRFEEGEFEKFYGYPPPPLLPVRSQADVLEGLLFVADHPERAAQMGQRAREWFDTHNGISLAKKWLALVTGP